MSTKKYTKRYQIFLELLHKARIESGMTQLEVAEILGKPQSYVSKCESGERRVDVIELEEFARIYEKQISYFFKFT